RASCNVPTSQNGCYQASAPGHGDSRLLSFTAVFDPSTPRIRLRAGPVFRLSRNLKLGGRDAREIMACPRGLCASRDSKERETGLHNAHFLDPPGNTQCNQCKVPDG